MVRKLKPIFAAFAVVVLIGTGLSAQEQNPTADHFASGEDVSPAFAWEPGAECTLSDELGVVMRSDWQKRHWIKIAGKQIEFNGETEMSDEGWYQEFFGAGFHVVLRLQRILPEPAGSDGVRFTGEIEVRRSAMIETYQVTGSWGA